jgi:hypothetical protein
MKPSHYTTPRTLADCQFTSGYPTRYRFERQAKRADVFMVVVCVAAAGLMLLGVI